MRRHLVEHAAAGQVLDDRFLSWEFLPFVDTARLRPLTARSDEKRNQVVGGATAQWGAVEAWRRAAHAWRWDEPGANADAMAFWSAALGHPSKQAGDKFWWTRWARCRVGSGEILGRHTATVAAVATTALPDGRPVAVTGSDDETVRIWDLTTGTPIGDPLTGDTDTVAAVATMVLPDGRPVAVTGSDDRTVRIWDLTTCTPIGDPLTGDTDTVAAVATTVLPDGRPVAVTGSDDRTVRIWDLTTYGRLTAPDTLVAIDVAFQCPLDVGFDLAQLLVGLVHAGQMPTSDLPAIHHLLAPAYQDGMNLGKRPAALADIETGYIGSLLIRAASTSLPFREAIPALTDVYLDQRIMLTRSSAILASRCVGPPDSVRTSDPTSVRRY